MKKIIFVLSIGLLFTLTSCDKKTQKKVKASIENVIDDVKDAVCITVVEFIETTTFSVAVISTSGS